MPSSSRRGELESYINLLGSTRCLALLKRLVAIAPDNVIKTICDIALNAQRGSGILIPTKVKKRFSRKKRVFQTLTSRKIGLKRKRKIIQGSGFATLLPILISTVLSTLGPSLFKRK